MESSCVSTLRPASSVLQDAGGGAAAAGGGHGAAHPHQPPHTPSQGAGAGQVGETRAANKSSRIFHNCLIVLSHLRHC